jgi:lysophospholipase L1-like esterase
VTLRILCIGDSITQGGVRGRAEWTYRLPLQEMLRDAGIAFDFIGTQSTGVHPGVEWPSVRGVPFDPEHEGYYGWTTADVCDRLRGHLPKLPPPDVALIHLGTNDQRAEDFQIAIVTPLEDIVAQLRERNPKVAVFIGHLCFDFGPALEIRPLVETMAARLDSAISPVMTVHHYRDWREHPEKPGAHTFDWVHPNPDGQRHMAAKWFEAMKERGLVPGMA